MRTTPTIIELQESITNDLKVKLDIAENENPDVIIALASVLAAQLKLCYLSLNDIQRNGFPDTAVLSEFGGTLERLGLIYLNRNPNPAISGVFNVSVTGDIGSVLRSGLTFKSNDDSKNAGQIYILDNEFTFTAENEIIEIRALVGGIVAALDVNDSLTITEPVIGVDKTAIVTEIVSDPIEAESIEEYRKDILNAIQLEPQGGAKSDYRIWAADADGVRFIYPYLKDSDAGTVQIFVEANKADSTDGNGTAGASILTDVQDVIEFDPDTTKPLNERGRRPIQANVEVLTVTTSPVDITINGLNDDNATVKAAIESSIDSFLTEIRPFISGADLVESKNDTLVSAKLSSLITSVISSDNFFSSVTVDVDGGAITEYLFDGGDIPYLSSVNYV